jgi:uncharacterized protein (DUF433 family)
MTISHSSTVLSAICSDPEAHEWYMKKMGESLKNLTRDYPCPIDKISDVRYGELERQAHEACWRTAYEMAQRNQKAAREV